MDTDQIAKLLNQGKVGVIPTDTLYGIHGLALEKAVVEHIYKLRNRELHKPFIVLIGKISDLKKFDIHTSEQENTFLKKVWPGKVSVILPCSSEKFSYIHRGLGTIAFRVPDNIDLVNLLNITGPLVSTSVNPANREPAKTIEEAKSYFGDSIDFYVDEGPLDSPPSTLIRLANGVPEILRKGAGEVTNLPKQ